MTALRLIFAGSGTFGATVLHALGESPHQICAVLTQPDRPAGRRLQLQPTAVAEIALAEQWSLFRPETLDSATHAQLAELNADVLVVVDFGRILPKPWLELCLGGSLNIHASLLPRWRGAAPIERALEAGDSEGGCTVMLLNEEMDAGDILLQEAVTFDADETAASARARLAPLGARLLLDYLKDFDPTHPQRQTQDSTAACKAPALRKQEAPIVWETSAAQIAAKIRAFNPRPVATAQCEGETLRLWHARAHPLEEPAEPGRVLSADVTGLWVACGSGQVQITELQRPGGRRMSARDFCNARPMQGLRLT